MSDSIEYDINVLAEEPTYGDDWTESSQQRLYHWKRRAIQLRSLHEQAMFKNRVIYIRLKSAAILLSVMTSMFIAFEKKIPSLPFQTLSIISSAAVSFLSGLDFLLGPQDRCTGHRNAVGSLTHLVNTVNYFCSLKPNKRPDVEVAYVMVTNEMYNVETTAPPVPFQKIE